MDALARSKSMAKALRKALAQHQIELPHSACLEIVARQFGFSDWNILKAAFDNAMSLSFTIFVKHGREREAALFYEAALGAVQTKAHHLHEGELMAVDMQLGDRTISICGSNPHREAEPSRGGPFFLKENGSGSTIFRLEVRDAAAVLKTAVAAGATIRNRLEVADDGHRVAAFFDPFGHVWALHERDVAMNRQAA
ncbi:glyoxalase superfamily protein [Microvirga sp. VF16]|uniref:glyoxalase superfamily protein n=1 Tax=Microvirga sp. VF16 TaxID=2807101 RepID=UPI00193CEC2B|nr:glyoxalase superfamily protein [Microvirga sp. VF16]QRM32696.1 VOC family protein [Microvirga sp. VF16]